MINCNVKIFVLLLVLVSLFSGCVFLDWGQMGVSAPDEVRVTLQKANRLIGKTKTDVLLKFGEPGDIRYEVYYHDKNTYDEVWYYKYDAGIPLIAPNQYGVTFYFIG